MFPRIIAHRGASADAPENTLSAFKLALEQGADGLELDVQITSDGEPVVIHDEKVDRTTSGSGYLLGYSYKELRKLDAGTWYGAEYSGQQVPHLQEVLELIAGQDVLLNIELKNGLVQYPGLEEKVLGLLSKYLSQDVIISSFNHYSLQRILAISPGAKVGALYMAGLVEPWFYGERLGVKSLHPLYLNIIPELVTGCKNRGIELYPWTVDEESAMQQLCQLRVEGIITNYPAKLAAIKGELSE